MEHTASTLNQLFNNLVQWVPIQHWLFLCIRTVYSVNLTNLDNYYIVQPPNITMSKFKKLCSRQNVPAVRIYQS